MFIHNESYDDKIMRLRYEMLIMHSKTGQALGLDKAEDFDSALEEAFRPEILRVDETPSTETSRVNVPRRQTSSFAGTAQSRWLNNRMPAGRDTVIAEAAKRYAQAMDVYEKRDTVFVAPA